MNGALPLAGITKPNQGIMENQGSSAIFSQMMLMYGMAAGEQFILSTLHNPVAPLPVPFLEEERTMPLCTVVVEDTSPMIEYSDGWRAGTSGDSSADQYTESSFTVTQVKDATMSFSFFGTSVAVFGARRGNHGAYHATFDGEISPTFDGKAGSDTFNQNLYSSPDSASNLGPHNLVIFNDDTTYFDVDYIMFQTSIGQDNESIIVNTFQDTHPAFSYTPPSSWGIPSNVGSFSGSSGHASTNPGSEINFTFQFPSTNFQKGDTIALYGPVGPNSTQSYSVKIDDASPTVLNANKQFYRAQQILFFAGNLGPGQHSLVIQLDSPSTGEFAIDYANVYTSPSLGGTYFGFSGESSSPPTGVSTEIQTSASGQSTSTCPPMARPLSPGVIAGLVTTSIFGVLATLFSVFLVWHYRRTMNSHDIRPPRLHLQPQTQPQPQPQPTSYTSSPNTMRTNNESILTARPYVKVPVPTEQSFGISSVTLGSSSSPSAVTHTTRASLQRGPSIYSMSTQPPQYQ